MKKKSQLIVALDVPSVKEAKKLIDLLSSKVKIFKVGSQLFTLAGPEVVRYINKKGAEIFLDLKFYDIPNTVANAVSAATGLGVKMMTLHISGGMEMLRAAVHAVGEEAARMRVKKPMLIGVTILTSQEAGSDEVLALAKNGLENGLDGVVCSVREAKFLRDKIKKDFIIVTPGIRSNKASQDDQKRTATVREAYDAGSDFLVVGRPILAAQNPLDAVKEFNE
jgi:orotidine-5'-phosphate decarboxylase